ncbi:MAG TPA: L-lactate dehydrogenase [Clostridiales bacterium]|nr:L-lactate dehydrogenase [Clostridiales bacterium]
MDKVNKCTKISVIGAGAVGATAAYALTLDGLAEELVIVDVNKTKAEGEVLDLNHGAAFIKPIRIIAGDYPDTKDSDIVIVTAGAAQKPGETRIELVNKNIKIFESIIPQVTKYNPNCILLIVSNPVDILSYVAYNLSGFPSERVIGSGTVLDTSRLKYEISKKLATDPRDIQTYIMGEHGDTEFPAWSLSHIQGIKLEQYAQDNDFDFNEDVKSEMHEKVKNAAYEVINKKGSTSYAIGLAIKRIVEAILGDELSVLPVSTLLDNYYGISNVYLGVPSIVGRNGVEKPLKVLLQEDEAKKLKHSADMLKNVLNESYLKENKKIS